MMDAFRMGSITCLILLFSGFSVRGAYEGESDYDYDSAEAEDCVIHTSSPSSFVTALNYVQTTPTGCQSQEVTPDNREVHVIRLLKTQGAVYESPIEVTLNIKPRSDIVDSYSDRLVFVLSSEVPIVWSIHGQRMSNQTKHIIWMSRNSKLKSRLRKSSESLNMRVKKEDLPHSRTALIDWARSDAVGAVTSYSDVQSTLEVSVSVGRDEAAPTRCSVTESPLSDLNAVKVITLETQQIDSCVARSNLGYNSRDVHIIEVRSPVGGATPPTVLVEITQRARRPHTRHLVLVLKADGSVKWVIHTRGIKGDVEIIADQQCDIGSVDLQSVSIAAERLAGLSGQQLVTWTKEKYGPAVSYTGVEQAAKFVLLVDGADVRSPTVVHRALLRSQSVQCGDNLIKVILNKRLLQSYGVSRQHLSLLDMSCVAVDNGTHYLLQTTLEGCQTTSDVIDMKERYTNAVVLRHMLSDGEVGEFSGSGHDLSSVETHVDDEDIDVDPREISSPVTCTYSPRTHVVAQRLLVSLYGDSEFGSRLPESVTEGDTVYVEASISGVERSERVLVDHCYVLDAMSRDRHNLIRNRCPVDQTLEDVVSSDSLSQRFKFKVRQYFTAADASGKVTQYKVFCQLSHCSLDSNAINKCLNPICSNKVVHIDFNRQVEAMSSFTVTATSKCESGAPASCPLSPSHGARGLDSPTVIAIAFGAFFIGVLLVASLWIIHSKTGSKTSPPAQQTRLMETSGDSTPSSTAPITIHQVNT